VLGEAEDREGIPVHSVRDLFLQILELKLLHFSPRARSVGAINDDWRIDILVLVTP
jgi:hypothetical protein